MYLESGKELTSGDETEPVAIKPVKTFIYCLGNEYVTNPEEEKHWRRCCNSPYSVIIIYINRCKRLEIKDAAYLENVPYFIIPENFNRCGQGCVRENPRAILSPEPEILK